MKAACLVTALLFIAVYQSNAQYSWNWRDPNDLNFIDPGDNKLIIYNALGLGLIYLLSKPDNEIPDREFSSLTMEYGSEYRKEPLSEIYSIKYRHGYKIRKYLWAGYEIMTTFIPDQKKIPGFGASPFFMWNIINKPSLRISYDNGVGPVIYSNPFPQGGTSFNFYTYYGIDFEITRTKMSYSLGLRNTHISNAGIKGRKRNPSFDGIGGYFRLRF